MVQFKGLEKSEWNLIKGLFPPPPPNKFGRKDLAPKRVINTILWVLITGARWVDAPTGRQWAPRSTAHEWLGKWQQTGVLQRAVELLLEKADALKLAGFERLKVDGFFFTGTRWGRRSSPRVQRERSYNTSDERHSGQSGGLYKHCCQCFRAGSGCTAFAKSGSLCQGSAEKRDNSDCGSG